MTVTPVPGQENAGANAVSGNDAPTTYAMVITFLAEYDKYASQLNVWNSELMVAINRVHNFLDCDTANYKTIQGKDYFNVFIHSRYTFHEGL